MKISNFKFLLIAVFAITLSFASCGNSSKDSAATEATEQLGAEYTSAYVCPMHCEGSGSEEAGKCPVCGMDYVANEDHKGDGHKH